MKFAFIAAEKAWPVSVVCDVLGVSRAGYYAWKTRPASARQRADAELVGEIAAAHKTGRGAYGSPRVLQVLRRKGRCVSKKRVERLMRQEGIAATKRRKFCVTTDSRHGDPIAPNVLQRQFEAPAANVAWVTDVTYVWTREGWLYLAAILDLCSRRVVGWSTSKKNDRELALDALQRAVRSRQPPKDLIHHSDRGSVYASGAYREALRGHGIRASMSRKGDCWDNAVAESFFATIKGELIDRREYETHAEARFAIADYIDAFYNVIRLHSTNGYMSPVEFELRLGAKVAAA